MSDRKIQVNELVKSICDYASNTSDHESIKQAMNKIFEANEWVINEQPDYLHKVKDAYDVMWVYLYEIANLMHKNEDFMYEAYAPFLHVIIETKAIIDDLHSPAHSSYIDDMAANVGDSLYLLRIIPEALKDSFVVTINFPGRVLKIDDSDHHKYFNEQFAKLIHDMVK